jgi:chromosomal replication initiator protein
MSALEARLRERVGEPRYKIWFARNTQFAWDGETLHVGVPNRFYLEWLQNTFAPMLEEAARGILGPKARVGFRIDPELFQESRRQQEAADATPAPSIIPAPSAAAGPAAGRWLQLDDFVVGDSNRLAYAAASALLGDKDDARRLPLTLYGPVGVGKTHLLEGVYTRLCLDLGGDKVVFVTAEDFTNRFLHAVRNGKQAEFRRVFRTCVALVVDDVHFFARKRATQEEFLHTFDALRKHGRPIVLAADRLPKDIDGLLPELADRIMGGSVWAIAPPDRRTRTAILKAKAHALPCHLPPDVVQHLADQLNGNVRELEAAVNAVHHYSLVHQTPPTLESVRLATANVIQHRAKVVRLKDIDAALTEVLGLHRGALKAAGRARTASTARMLAMYLARKHTGAAYAEIGRYFGGRNHSTVIAAEKKVRRWLQQNEVVTIAEARWRVGDLLEKVTRILGV